MNETRRDEALRALFTRVSEDTGWAAAVLAGIAAQKQMLATKLPADSPLLSIYDVLAEPIREIEEKGTATVIEFADVAKAVCADIARRN